MKEIFFSNLPAGIAVIGLVVYFFGMAIVFISSPIKNAEKFAVKPVDNAGKTEIRVPCLKVKAVETTGAGDAFNGGLATAIAEKMPMEQALQFATCTAAISVTRLGSAPSMPYRHEILALMEKEFGVKL